MNEKAEGVNSASSQNALDETARDNIGLLDLVLQKTRAGYLFQTVDLAVMLAGNLPDLVTGLASENGEIQVLGVEQGNALIVLKQTVFKAGEAASTEFDLPSPGGTVTFRIDLERIRTHGSDGILSVVTDVTDARHRERVLKTLLRELSHRSKNLLAIIQGIATQTARQAFSLDSFLVKFRGRIQSLASSQDLVTDSSWRGAFLFDLAEKQFSAYWPDPRRPMVVGGIDAHLSPNAALHIGLALHELIVNSASHGAIAAGATSLKIDCFETTYQDKAALELAWIETVPVADPDIDHDEPSFARTVLERVVPIAIAGTAVYITRSGRIEYHLTIPQHEYEIIARIEPSP